MEFDIKDGISFVRTLTRNVISLWDEVSTPSCTDSTNLFSQSEGLLADDPNLFHVTCMQGSVVEGVSGCDSRRKKIKKRLTFDENEKGKSDSVVEIFRNDRSGRKIGPILNRDLGSISLKINRNYFDFRNLFLTSRFTNYTFPLYQPLKRPETRLPLWFKALNLSINRTRVIETLEDRTKNSVQLSSINNPKSVQCDEDTKEFENDIRFLETVANKTSTPIKDGSPKSKPKAESPFHEMFESSYNGLTDGLFKIFSSNSAMHFYTEALKELHSGDQPLADCNQDNGGKLNSENEERRSPKFASEDEEAVYYLLTKYLK